MCRHWRPRVGLVAQCDEPVTVSRRISSCDFRNRNGRHHLHLNSQCIRNQRITAGKRRNDRQRKFPGHVLRLLHRLSRLGNGWSLAVLDIQRCRAAALQRCRLFMRFDNCRRAVTAMKWQIKVFAAAFLVFCTVSCGGECTKNALDKVVKSFRVEELSPVQAILVLGEREHLCFGLRNLTRREFLEPVTRSFENHSTRQILAALMSPRAVLEETDTGTIYVQLPTNPDFASLFDYRLNIFHVGRVSLQTASLAVSIQLKRAIDPSITGFAGSYATGDASDLVGPHDRKDLTISEALNLIVGQSKGATWIATAPDKLSSRSDDGLWTIVQYDRPAQDYFALISNLGAHYPTDDSDNLR